MRPPKKRANFGQEIAQVERISRVVAESDRSPQFKRRFMGLMQKAGDMLRRDFARVVGTKPTR